MNDDTRPLYLVSACLVGLCTRYDGATKENPKCLAELRHAVWIPVCPEQLGGLPTPREAADIAGGDGADVLIGGAKILTKSGVDLSAAFIHGAEQVLQIARSQQVDGVFLKARSPSCAVTGTIGVTAALLRAAGIPLTEF
ncbi:MAG: hypothetical protein A2X81_15855 [Desulfobacterales bacterium GWB2_56_26]|nr:MAG: hypothetical protein A2X81_15855 [Desulfobacterales bacterium GWB2_56_26]